MFCANRRFENIDKVPSACCVFVFLSHDFVLLSFWCSLREEHLMGPTMVVCLAFSYKLGNPHDPEY
jgi:hypothetical protein